MRQALTVACDGGETRCSERFVIESSLRCQVETAFESLNSLQNEWDETVLKLGGPVYMSFDWLTTWWRFYGHGKQLRLFLFWHENELVALLPLYLEVFGRGPFKTKVARLVGANIPPKTFNPPVDPAWAEQAFALLLNRLFREERCDLLSIGPVSTVWSTTEGLKAGCAARRHLVSSASWQVRDVQSWFELPDKFEEYLSTLSSTERKNRLKRLRHLERGRKVSSDVVTDPALVERAFDDFLSQHTRQWKELGKAGHFGAWPNAEAYNRALLRAQARHGRVFFFRMLVDGEVVSNRYTFLFGRTVFSELPARAVGEPWDKLGIGGISLLKFNESAIQVGVRAVDSGLGAYEHKSQLGGSQIPVGVWHVKGRGLSGVKARVFLLLSRAVLGVCHKIWYRRVLPNLPPRFKRMQSINWLRFDV